MQCFPNFSFVKINFLREKIHGSFLPSFLPSSAIKESAARDDVITWNRRAIFTNITNIHVYIYRIMVESEDGTTRIRLVNR